MHWQGKVDNCYWFHFATLTQNDWDEYLKFTKLTVSSKDSCRLILCSALSGWDIPSANQRLSLSNVIKDNTHLGTKPAGIAFVVDSSLIVGALTAVRWIVKTSCPEKISSNLFGAFDFFHKIDSTFSEKNVVSDMRKIIPPLYIKF